MMQLRLAALLKGAATFVPGVVKLACGGSGGTVSARYCYSVWLRHLSLLTQHGFDGRPNTVAELGPGDSIGIGLSAMLSGADRYFAFDALPHARTAANLKTLDRLADLFASRAEIPGSDEFPQIHPEIASLQFPQSLLPDAIDPRRVAAIRAAVEGSAQHDVAIHYAAPWYAAASLQSQTVDLVISQAVLEHVDDIETTYGALNRWLKPGGMMSHQIDFKCHGMTREWYGHWTVPAPLWRLTRGRRPYFINRLPASAHVDAMRRAGFEIVAEIPVRLAACPRQALAADFRYLTDDDLSTSGLFVIARKPTTPT